MGWLRLVGSSKLYVSLAEYSLFCRALVQKRPMILRSLLIEATPYVGKYRQNLARAAGLCDFTAQGVCVCVYVCVCVCVYVCVWRWWRIIGSRKIVSVFLCIGWLRLVGCLKWQVSFAEYRLLNRALLQKRPVILRSLLIEATPYSGSRKMTHNRNASIFSCAALYFCVRSAFLCAALARFCLYFLCYHRPPFM